MKNLNAKNLKESLWNTLNRLVEQKITPAEADAVASQAREILRTTSVQLRISSQATRQVPASVIAFSEETGD